MGNKQDWSVEFYTDSSGESPVEKFLETVDKKTLARFDWGIEQLRVRNVQARDPLVKHLDDKLWELRRASAGNIYRILYFFFTGKRIVFVHGFQKKSQKTPRKEINIAKQRMDDFMKREEGGD